MTYITKSQVEVLTLLYRFRFVTVPQVQKVLGQKNRQSTQAVLNRMMDNQLIARHYKSSDRLQNQPAVYYILPAGMKLLKDQKPGADKGAIKAMYKDKGAKDTFIKRQLTLGELSRNLQDATKRMQFFTKPELREYDFLPDPKPEAYVTIQENDSQFLVEVIDEGTPSFALRKLLKKYEDYAEVGTWTDATGLNLPTVLLVCQGPTLATKLNRLVNKLKESSSNDSLTFQVLFRTKKKARAETQA